MSQLYCKGSSRRITFQREATAAASPQSPRFQRGTVPVAEIALRLYTQGNLASAVRRMNPVTFVDVHSLLVHHS